LPFPNIQPVPGDKPMVIGVETEMFAFSTLNHYQCDISLEALVSGDTLVLRQYVRKQEDGLFYQVGPAVTITGQAGGGHSDGSKIYSFPMIAGLGVRVTGNQTAGVARTIDWCVYKV